MMQSAAHSDLWKTAVPITADALRRAVTRNGGGLKSYEPAFKLFPDMVTDALKVFHPSAARCTLEVAALRTLQPERRPDEFFCFSGKNGVLRAWLDVDRAFELAMCDMAFGGFGMGNSDEDASRPQSKIERGLRGLVCAEIATCIPRPFMAAFEYGLVPFQANPKDIKAWNAETIECAALKILVNVFTQNVALILLIPLSDLSRMGIGQSEAVVSSQRTAVQALAHCPMHFEFFLHPAAMPLDLILSLAPGSVLCLGLSVEDIVEVRCENERVFSARMITGQDALSIELVDPLAIVA